MINGGSIVNDNDYQLRQAIIGLEIVIDSDYPLRMSVGGAEIRSSREGTRTQKNFQS